MKSISIFFAFLLLGFLGSFTYLAFRLKKWSGYQGLKWKILIGSLVLIFSIVVAGTLYLRFNPENMRQWDHVSYLIFFAMGTLITLIFYTFFWDTSLFIKKILSGTRKAKNHPDPILEMNMGRRRFLSLGTLSLGSVAAGSAQAHGDPQINMIPVRIDSLPKEFSGFKIAQISDLHVGPMIGKDYVERVVELTNSLNADVIALTGDIADGPLTSIREDLAPLAKLRAKHGVFFITGNHEYYWDENIWIELFRSYGFEVLLNEHRIIQRDSASIAIGGVTDADAQRHNKDHFSDPQKAFAGLAPGIKKILLAHQPKSFKAASSAQVDLQISGHTHGGQFFPWNIMVAMMQPYYRGLNRHENMWIYTSTGTGFWGPPLRLAVSKEIALIELLSSKEVRS